MTILCVKVQYQPNKAINMRDGCIIGCGKGNEDWNKSAPHGAGRIMSRNEARAKLSLEAYKDTMADI